MSDERKKVSCGAMVGGGYLEPSLSTRRKLMKRIPRVEISG